MAYIVRSSYNDSILGAVKAAFGASVVPVLIGDPGTGKTEVIGQLAEQMNYRLIKLMGNTMDPTDIAGMPVRHQAEDGNWYTLTAPPEMAQSCMKDYEGTSDYDGTVVFLDELNTSPPAIQAAFLTMLQSRELPSGFKFPPTTKFIAAMNSAEDAADGWDLAAPLANRLMHIDWRPPVDDWFTGMLEAWGKQGISEQERSVRTAVVTFLRSSSDLVSVKPEQSTDAGKAWPSRRTWDNLTRVLGEIDFIRSIPDQMVALISTGLVGEAASAKFLTFLDGFTLPSSEEVLTEADNIDWDEMTSDKVYAILGSTLSYVGTERRKEMFAVMMAAAGSRHKDIAAAFATPFLRNYSSSNGVTGDAAVTAEEAGQLSTKLNKVLVEAGYFGA